MILQIDIGYWAFFGTIYLIIMTYQDFKQNRLIDDRHNYFLMGLSISLLSHFQRSFWYILSLALLIVIFSIITRKYNLLGEGDISALRWIIIGLAIISPYVLMYFLGIFAVLSLLYVLLLKYVFRKPDAPFFNVLLGSFIIISVWFDLYILL